VPHPLRRVRLWVLRSEQRVGLGDVVPDIPSARSLPFPFAHLLQNLHEEITAVGRSQKGLSAVTAAGDEVPVTGIMEPPQAFGHG
jgi:hypothetical protein